MRREEAGSVMGHQTDTGSYYWTTFLRLDPKLATAFNRGSLRGKGQVRPSRRRSQRGDPPESHQCNLFCRRGMAKLKVNKRKIGHVPESSPDTWHVLTCRWDPGVQFATLAGRYGAIRRGILYWSAT